MHGHVALCGSRGGASALHGPALEHGVAGPWPAERTVGCVAAPIVGDHFRRAIQICHVGASH
eukprot:5031337-Alexandrium_andersonii.AAC.1